MPASGLIDTGAILALLHEDDRWHERCRAAFREMRVPLATSVAVLTEVFHIWSVEVAVASTRHGSSCAPAR